MEALVNYGSGAKKTHLGTSYWFSDNLNALDTDQLTEGHRAQLNARKSVISGSKTIDMTGNLHSDFFKQHKYIIPSCNLRIKLLRSDPKFCLLKTADDDKDYRVDITKCDLLLRKVKVNPSVATNINSLLLKGEKVLYPLSKVETQFFSISPGRLSERINLLISRQEPKRIVFGFQKHSAKNGNYLESGVSFKTCNVASLWLLINGHPVPNKPLRLDYDTGEYIQAYTYFQMTVGKTLSNEDNGITREQYANGFAMYGFDLTADLCEGSDVHLLKNSTIALEVTFKRALQDTLSLFVYTEGDDMLEINNSRVVTRLSKT